jgi:DNA helicase-2/ATP-dependent DNA helicase PcrA
MHNLKTLLNDKQYEAVSQTEGSYLILAGAGSGKTRVITYKIANIINKGINSEKILAVTFTNKAANEMKERVSSLLKTKKLKVLVTTFHSLGVKILRDNIKMLGYREKFSIFDEGDCKKIIKDIISDLKLPDDKYNPDTIIYKISDIKMNMKNHFDDPSLKKIYVKYEEYLKIHNAVDFDDLIKLPIEIFKKHPAILEKYQKKWEYVLVDEYQDTSVMQYELIRLIAIKHKNLTIVGDDDQSIYSWRGANPENILLFETDFHPVKEIRLEQNYRSCANILNAANSLIKNNSNRKSKNLWTNDIAGDPIKIHACENEEDEADFVCSIIRKLYRSGYQYKDIAILFRMNSQSRPFEELFRENNIPYKMIGGTNFFDRAEIKDIISYLRFLVNTDDEVSLVRIINNPKRGIGNTTLMELMNHAKETNSGLYSTIKDFISLDKLGKKITPYLEDFYNLIENYRERIYIPKKMSETVNSLIFEIDYRSKLIHELKDSKKVEIRMNNLNQLVQSIARYENNPDNFDPNIYDYLQKISITSKDDETNDDNAVNMMSIHSAKGLEFKCAFIVGAEEGLIPHHKTVSETGNIEEERRLFYVAITRAREKLFITYPKIRMKFNEAIPKSQSGFIDEIPKELTEQVNIEKEIDAKQSLELLMKKMKKNT